MNVRMNRKKHLISVLIIAMLLIVCAGSTQAAWKKVSGGKKYKTAEGVYLKNGLHKIKGKYYYFDKKGFMKTGWITFSKGRRYFGKKDGVMFVGLKKIGSYKYYFTTNGYRKSGWVTIDDKEYFFGQTTGRMQTKKLVDDNRYYVTSNGTKKVTAGIITYDKKKYYVNKGGLIAKNTTVKVNNVTYKADANGVLTVNQAQIGKDIAAYALKYKGNPYVYGGISLTKGADCSGFVYTLFGKFGIKLLRSSYEQEKGPSKTQQKAGYTPGKEVSVSLTALQPGDLLFYGVRGNSGHVALYIGDGKIIHAADETRGIRVDKYNYNKPIKAMRYF